MEREFDLENLENELLNSLNPVKPRREFVSRLKGRLTNNPQVVLENPENTTPYWLALVGILGGVLFTLVLRRLIGYLTSRS